MDRSNALVMGLQAMFIFYAAKDAALEARRQKAAKSQKNPTKKVDLWTEKHGANAGVSMSKTMSALEFSEVSEPFGALQCQCFARLGCGMSDSKTQTKPIQQLA